jgi:H+-translocating NAD(P) transhydrogenase subunit alpha
LKLGIPKEVIHGETRVAVTPPLVALLKKDDHDVYVESGAGNQSLCRDDDYREYGAEIVEAGALYESSDVLFKVRPPAPHPRLSRHEAELMREGGVYIGFLAPLANADVLETFARRRITAFAMEFIPRITRAQSMDALSSMANLSGYKAVVMVADRLAKIFPLMMTAAGTIQASVILVLGAGVAGLQAIATAKRLGARVEAFDPRPAVKEQVESLGASFIEMELPEDAETKGGYAKEQSEEFIKKEMEAIGDRLPHVDAVITTAQVFGKRAPVLITEKMVKLLRPGSIIIDMAAEQGGNCELTVAGKEVVQHGVTIVGVENLPAAIPVHSSQFYARNVVNLFHHLYNKHNDFTLNFEDEITASACITHGGNIVNDMVKQAVGTT